jgi:hypothetical protein
VIEGPALIGAILAPIGLAASVGVGLVFVAAGLAKLRHRDVLPGVIANYRLLHPALVAPVAAVLPLAELAAGVGMLGGLRLAALAGALLLVAFALAMAINVGRGRTHIDCGCGRSQLRQPVSLLLVVRNVVLAALLAPRLIAAPAPDMATALVALAGGIALFVLFQLVGGLAALAASPLSAGRR